MEHFRKLRIVIVDGQYFFRRGLRTVLSSETDLHPVAEVATVEECRVILQGASPDVLILNAALDRTSLKETKSSPPILFVAEESHRDALHAAGQRYVLRSEAPGQIVGMLRQMAGQMSSGPSSSRHSADLQALARSTDGSGSIPGLTVRENEVFKCVAEGRTARDIAEELGLSVKTVEAHKVNLMRKLGLHNRADLMKCARQYAVVEPVAAA